MMKVCTGACLFGKCPFDECIKFSQKKGEARRITADMNILTACGDIDITPDQTGFGFAVDIGTTTIAAALFELETATQRCVSSCLNSQATLGLDVISRIKYAGDVEDGLPALNRAIVADLNMLIGKLLAEANLSERDISRMVITGNTTMLHLLCAISPVSMGVSPFTPVSLFGVYHRGEELALIPKKAQVYVTDCISSFVGGDITSAILASGMCDSYDTTLLLDIGTNGEVALGSKTELLVTSTAAGPAFEGATLSCGMAGVAGAISKVDVLQGELLLETIGKTKPTGICGSGVIDSVSLMLDTEVIDETGAFNEQEKFILAENVFINQKDIREIQTAKAAIAAGVLSLLHHGGKELSDIKRIYLSGGFGNFMDPENAKRMGLLPNGIEIQTIGNGALLGAAMALLSEKYVEKTVDIAKLGVHVELGNNPYFMEKYVDCMMFERI